MIRQWPLVVIEVKIDCFHVPVLLKTVETPVEMKYSLGPIPKPIFNYSVSFPSSCFVFQITFVFAVALNVKYFWFFF